MTLAGLTERLRSPTTAQPDDCAACLGAHRRHSCGKSTSTVIASVSPKPTRHEKSGATGASAKGATTTEPAHHSTRSQAGGSQASGTATADSGGKEVQEEAEGWQLHLSSGSNSGYKGVLRKQNGRFETKIQLDGKKQYLGCFDTVLEAAVAYARAAAGAENGGGGEEGEAREAQLRLREGGS